MSRQKGIIPWGIQDSQLPKRGKESRASAVFKIMSVEGSGFKPEALMCSVAPEWLEATLLSFERGSGRVTGLGRCGGVLVED